LTFAGDQQVRNHQANRQRSSSSNPISDTAQSDFLYSPTNTYVKGIIAFCRNLSQPIYASAYFFERISMKSKKRYTCRIELINMKGLTRVDGENVVNLY